MDWPFKTQEAFMIASKSLLWQHSEILAFFSISSPECLHDPLKQESPITAVDGMLCNGPPTNPFIADEAYELLPSFGILTTTPPIAAIACGLNNRCKAHYPFM
jgi:hypothetical protein